MSPVVTVSALILTVAVPFLAAMIAIYTAATVHRKRGDYGNITARADVDDARCDDPTTRLVSIVRYMYPDMPYAFKFACNGIIIGEDVVLTVPECFDEDDGVMTTNEIIDAYFVSSGSHYWLNLRTIQKIEKIVEFVMMDGQTAHRLKALRILGALPECTPASSSITLANEGCEYSFLGWNDDPRKQHQQHMSHTYRGTLSEKPCTNYTGGAVFKGQSAVALLRSNCQMERNETLPPNERYTLLWDYQEKIIESFTYAHVRRKDRDVAVVCENLRSSVSGRESNENVTRSTDAEIRDHSNNSSNESKYSEATMRSSSYRNATGEKKKKDSGADIYKVVKQLDQQISEELAPAYQIESTAEIPEISIKISKGDTMIPNLYIDKGNGSKYSEERIGSTSPMGDEKIIMEPEADPLSVRPLDEQSEPDFHQGVSQIRDLASTYDIESTVNMQQPSVPTPREDAKITDFFSVNDDVSKYRGVKTSTSFHTSAMADKKITIKPGEDPLSVQHLHEQGEADFYKVGSEIGIPSSDITTDDMRSTVNIQQPSVDILKTDIVRVEYDALGPPKSSKRLREKLATF